MPRPFPIWPRGGRRARATGSRHLLACPRLCPRWEIDALRALTKPQLKQTILFREAQQNWPKDAHGIITQLHRQLIDRVNLSAEFHFPDAGDYYFLADFPANEFDAAKAAAVAISRKFPDLWFSLDRLLVREGCFFRRDRRVRFTVSRTTTIHLPRLMRAALRGIV